MSIELTTPKNTRSFRDVPRASALAVTEGVVYTFSLTTGALSVAGASTDANQLLFISTQTLASGTTPVSCVIVSREDEFLADTVNNSNAAHNGQRMVLNATGDRVNNTGTDATAGVFVQVAVVGAAADRKVIVRHV